MLDEGNHQRTQKPNKQTCKWLSCSDYVRANSNLKNLISCLPPTEISIGVKHTQTNTSAWELEKHLFLCINTQQHISNGTNYRRWVTSRVVVNERTPPYTILVHERWGLCSVAGMKSHEHARSPFGRGWIGLVVCNMTSDWFLAHA